MINKLQLRITAILAGLFITALWALPLLAWAADAVVATAPPVVSGGSKALWQTLLLPVVSVVGLFIAAFLTVGLKKLTQLLEAKFKVDVPQAVEDLMKDKALQLCAWAEETAEDKLLHKNGTPTPGAAKGEQVVNAVLAFAESMGYGKQWQRERVEQLVAGVIHLNREGSEGVIGSNGTRGAALEAATTATETTTGAVTGPITVPPPGVTK